jgi:hypothetical protein
MYLFPFLDPSMLAGIRSFGGMLKALQGIFDTCLKCFRAELLQEPAPPAWWESEVSAILEPGGRRVDRPAENVWPHAQAQGENSKQIKLVPLSVDVFHSEDNPPFDAQSFRSEMDALPYNSRSFWFNLF